MSLVITMHEQMIRNHPEWSFEGVAKAYQLLADFQKEFKARYNLFEREDIDASAFWVSEFQEKWRTLLRENNNCAREWEFKVFRDGELMCARYYHGKSFSEIVEVFRKYVNLHGAQFRADGWSFKSETEIKINQSVSGVIARDRLVWEKGDEQSVLTYQANEIK